jgi:hypothetical protein
VQQAKFLQTLTQIKVFAQRGVTTKQNTTLSRFESKEKSW